VSDAPAGAKLAPGGGASGWRPWLLLAPLLVFLAAFFLVPLGQVLLMSVTDPEPGLGHFADIVGDAFFLRVLSAIA
jgi:putative spermidine/putrescine transport system permease protein